MTRKPETGRRKASAAAAPPADTPAEAAAAPATAAAAAAPSGGGGEARARGQWTRLVDPVLAGQPVDFTTLLQLGAGDGAMTAVLMDRAFEIVVVDPDPAPLAAVAARFPRATNLRTVEAAEGTLAGVATGSIGFVFCFDFLVQRDSDVVRRYLAEIARVLEPGGAAFLHHSNLTKNPGGDNRQSAHARSFMSLPMFKHYAVKEGLAVVRQKAIDWGQGPKAVKALDGLALVRRP
jgi:SAM-dependent methyltransferase